MTPLQHLLTLPMRRNAKVSATSSGNVRIEMTSPRTGEQLAWMELDPAEADLFAGSITATVTQIIAGRRAAAIEAAPGKDGVADG